MSSVLHLLSTAVLAVNPLGTLPGGYFVTQADDGTTLELRHADDIGTVLWSTTWQVQTLRDMSLTKAAVKSDTAIYATTFTTALELHRITLAAGPSLQIDYICDVASLGYYTAGVTRDGSEIFLRGTGGNNNIYAYDTATGLLAWQFDLGHSSGGSEFGGYPGPGRLILYYGGNFLLVDDTGAVLDTLAASLSYGPVWMPGPGTSSLVLDYDGAVLPMPMSFNIIDCDLGTDTLSWRNATWTSFTSDWMSADYYPDHDTSGSTMAIAPRDFAGQPGADLSAYLIDFEAGSVARSASNTTFGEGVFGVMTDSGYIVAPNIYYDGGTSTAFETVTVTPTYRPIGKSMHLRQRQTPYIT